MKKLRHGFADEKALTTIKLTGMTWKRIFNSTSELSQNPTEKQITLSKTAIKLAI